MGSGLTADTAGLPFHVRDAPGRLLGLPETEPRLEFIPETEPCLEFPLAGLYGRKVHARGASEAGK
jgi:hypothetical protein